MLLQLQSVVYLVSSLLAGAALLSRDYRSLLAADSSAVALWTKANASLSMGRLLQEYPYYHTTKQIHDELVALAARCPGMTLETRTKRASYGDTVSVDVVGVRAPGARPVNKNFVIFGEHARELISSESGLHLVRALCGKTELDARVADVLQDSEFLLIVNVNPRSREAVERGEYCTRENPSGVDLNRNYDEEWNGGGPKPFSEAETLIVKEVATEYNPTNFLTVHSGTRGLYMPWAYSKDKLATRNRPNMLNILKSLSGSYCECPFGAAGKEVGYKCPGTSLDWVYDKLQTPYSFAFEIYVSEDQDPNLKARWKAKLRQGASLLQVGSNLGHPFFKDLFKNHPSHFVQLASSKVEADKRYDVEDNNWCIHFYNPETEAVYNRTVRNWVNAYLDMADLVAQDLRAGNGIAPRNLTGAKPLVKRLLHQPSL